MHLCKNLLADWAGAFFMRRVMKFAEWAWNDVFLPDVDFYLCLCEGGFKERAISTGQVYFAKPDHRLLLNQK